MKSFLDRAAEIEPTVTALRRRLHRRPEIGLRLPETQRAILGALDGLGLRDTRQAVGNSLRLSACYGETQRARWYCCAPIWMHCRLLS